MSGWEIKTVEMDVMQMARPKQYRFDNVFLPRKNLIELVNRLPTPFYLYDEAGMIRTVQETNEAFSWNVGHRDYFPLRACPNHAIIKLLSAHGRGFFCVSERELAEIADCGCSGNQVIYGSLCPTKTALERLVALDGTLVIDSPFVGDFCMKENLIPRRILLSYNPAGKLIAESNALARPERSKMGMTEDDIIETAKKLMDFGATSIGLHGEMGDNIVNARYYGAVLKSLYMMKQKLEDAVSVEVSILNLGGGMGMNTLPEAQNPSIQEMGAYAQQVAKNIGLSPGVQVQTAIGRLLMGPNGILLTKVLLTKEITRKFAVVDVSTAQLARLKQGAYQHISVVGNIDTAGREFYDIVGTIPDVNDRIGERRLIPPIKAGDYIVIHDVGFCGIALASDYGAGCHCGEYLYCADGSVKEIRKLING